VSNGKMATLTTINSRHMKRFQVVTREHACPSLLVATMINQWAIMTNRWSMLVSILGQPLSKRRSTTSRTRLISTPSGNQEWETASPTSSNISSRRTRIGTTYSRVSILTRHSDRLQQHPTWGKRIPHYLR
jgi:hypothetical protein